MGIAKPVESTTRKPICDCCGRSVFIRQEMVYWPGEGADLLPLSGVFALHCVKCDGKYLYSAETGNMFRMYAERPQANKLIDDAVEEAKEYQALPEVTLTKEEIESLREEVEKSIEAAAEVAEVEPEESPKRKRGRPRKEDPGA